MPVRFRLILAAQLNLGAKLDVAPIGMIHSPHREMEVAPVQPRWAAGREGTVEVFRESARELRDVDGFEHVWLLYWFDWVRASQLEVVPYSDTQSHGVFATRAPRRPNPIGFSWVRRPAVEGKQHGVADLDVLEGTPLLDIKPCVPDCDVFEVERVGWWQAGRSTSTADHGFTPDKPSPLSG